MYEFIKAFAPRNSTVFERHFLLEYFSQRAKHFTMCYVSLALELPVVNSYLTCFLLYARQYANVCFVWTFKDRLKIIKQIRDSKIVVVCHRKGDEWTRG